MTTLEQKIEDLVLESICGSNTYQRIKDDPNKYEQVWGLAFDDLDPDVKIHIKNKLKKNMSNGYRIIMTRLLHLKSVIACDHGIKLQLIDGSYNMDETNLNKHFDTIYDVWCKVLTLVGINVKTTSRKLFKRDADYIRENNINVFEIRGIFNTFFDINVSKYIVKFTKYKNYEEMLNALAEANFEQIWLINRYLKYLCLFYLDENQEERDYIYTTYGERPGCFWFKNAYDWLSEMDTGEWQVNYNRLRLYLNIDDNNQFFIPPTIIHLMANTH